MKQPPSTTEPVPEAPKPPAKKKKTEITEAQIALHVNAGLTRQQAIDKIRKETR